MTLSIGFIYVLSFFVCIILNVDDHVDDLFVCLRVAALVTYELAPWKCTD